MQHRFRKPCRTSLLLILWGLTLFSLAAPVHAAGEEETVARNFLQFLGSDKTILSSEVLQRNPLDPALPPVTVGHLFHLQDGGYLVVSPDRSITPVKAYSLSGNFAALPPPYREALLAELELRVRVALAGAARAPLEAGMTETEKRWDFLLRFDGARAPLAYMPDTYLLQTKWNQGYPYNKFLPAVGGQTVLAGCVNVALAQVMRYHKYPAFGKGVVSYEWTPSPPPLPQPPWPSQTLKTILYRPLNWDRMPAAVDAAIPEYQADEVALLMRDLGIANRTAFDADGSSTYLRTDVLMKNYGYSTSLASMDNTAADLFLAKLQTEIFEGRPVLLTFPGHMTVADGYSSDGTGTKVHVNMGWGGSVDNFYFLDGTPVPIGGSSSFPTDAGKLHIYYNVKPCGGSDCDVNLETGDGINGQAITGYFNRNGDTDIYEAYLKGPTTLSATRGYSNLAFSISIVDVADGSVVFPAPDPNIMGNAGKVFDAGSLAAGKYAIRVSLCNDAGTYCYGADPNNHYTATLTTDAVAPAEMAAIDQALDRPPVIGNAFPDIVLNTNSGTRKILIDARDENGDPVTLQVRNSNPAAVGAVLNGNLLELTPTGVAKVSARIAVRASANGKTTEKALTVMTDNAETVFGKTFTVGGTFAGQSDIRTHRAILGGACTITGSTVGYSDQGFFSSVRNANETPRVAAGDIPISDTFTQAVYLLDASLEKPGMRFTYKPGDGDQYLFAVSCPDADETTATIAGILGIDLAGAGLPIIWLGDVNGDGAVTLADAILSLQILSGMDTSRKAVSLRADVNGDGKIGLADLLFILQTAAGLRSP